MVDLEIKLVNKHEINQLMSHSYLPKKIICFNESASKTMEKCFLFHLKGNFRSQDI